MKHPALTRAMAFILAIVSIILLLAAKSGLKEAELERLEALEEHEIYVGRIELYKELSAQLEGLEAYKSADETLSEKEEQHDKDASQHRTDVATHTATEGGYKSGADALWEAKALLKEKSGEYYAGLNAFNAKKAEFEQMKAMAEGIPLLAGACTMASAQAAATVPVSPPGDAPTEPAAPTPPTAPIEPPMPAVPVQPVPPAQPVPPTMPDRANYETDEAYAQACADYDSAMAQHQTAMEQYNAAYTVYLEKDAAYQQDIIAYNGKKAEYDAQMLVYAPLKTQYDADMLVYADEKAGYDSLKAQYDIDKANWDSADAAYKEYAAKLEGWTKLMQQGGAIMAAVGGAAPATAPDAAGLAAMSSALQLVHEQLQPQIEAGEAGIAEAEKGLAAAKEALDKADREIQGNLENIWYHMGKLEDEAQELNEEKEQLSKSSEELEEERLRLERQKEAENKLRSTRILLMKKQSVAEAVEAGGDLVEAALACADEMAARCDELYEGRRFIAYLSIAAGVLGLVVLPAAFELIKSRFLLIFPALLSLLAAAACVYINYLIGEGNYYAAMPVVIFALLYLLAALPKKRKIKNR